VLVVWFVLVFRGVWSVECEVSSDLLAPGRKFFTLHFSLFTFNALHFQHSSLFILQRYDNLRVLQNLGTRFYRFSQFTFYSLQCMILPDIKFKLYSAKYHILRF